jgi:rubredoxin
MKCTLCGFEFDEKNAKAGCADCLMMKNCGLIKCPNCGYEFPKTPEWINKLLEKGKSK